MSDSDLQPLFRNQPPVVETIQSSVQQASQSNHDPPPAKHPELCSPAESFIIRLLEEYNFCFTTATLPTVKGFLVCEDGYRAITIADDLDSAGRLFLYFHMLGHIVLGHTHKTHLTIKFDPRSRAKLLVPELFEERCADLWAKRFMRRLAPRWADNEHALIVELQDALGKHNEVRGGLVPATTEDLSTHLFETREWYRRWRTNTRIHCLRVGLDRLLPV